MLNNFPIESVSVDTEKFGSLGLVPTGFGKSALNEFSFEFVHSFAEINVAIDHFRNERFQLLFHGISLRMDFLSQLLPPAFEGTVTYEEFGFQLIRRQNCNRSRPGKEVRRKRRIFDPLRLHIKGS